MYATYYPQNIKFSLAKDDIDAVQYLYKGGNNLNSIIRISGVAPASVQVNTSQSFTMSINNDGNKTLQVTDVNITNNSAGAFSFANGKPSLPINILPYNKIDIVLKFMPTSLIQYNSTFTVTSDANSGSNTASLTGSGSANPPTNNSFTDSRDGKVYKIVQIGTQTWMAEDLNYVASGSVFFNNTRFYDYNTATTVAPAGWHLASDEEWQTLEVYLGMSSAEANTDGSRGTDQGYRVSVGGSSGLNLDYKGYGLNNYDGTVSSYMMGQTGCFWTSTKIWIGGINAYVPKARSIAILNPSQISRFNASVIGYNFYPVRCVKN